MRRIERTTTALSTATMTLLVTLTAAGGLLPMVTDRARRTFDYLNEDEEGASELVTGVLLMAGFAAVTLAVVAGIRLFVTNEVTNLPTSGN